MSHEQTPKGATGLATRPKQELVSRDGLPIDHVITRVEELVEQLDAMRQRAHVISPVLSTSSMASGFGAVLSIVKVDTAKNSRDFYPLKAKQKDKDDRGREIDVELFGPSKLLLNRIGAAAGVTWLPFPYSMRTDDRKTKWVWEFTSTGEYWAPDGKRLRITGTKEVDLRDGSALALTMTPAQLRQARPFGLELAETKSQLRALRRMGIAQQYTLKELEKPFVVVQFTFQPDMSKPEIALEVTKHYLGITNTLYPNTLPPGHELPGPADERAALPPSSARDLPPELGGGAAPQQSPTGPREASFDDDDEPDAADDRPRYAVASVLETGAGEWTVVLPNGAKYVTADRAVAKAASNAGKAGKAIALTADDDNGTLRIVELVVLEEPAPSGSAPAAADGGDGGHDDGLRYVRDVKEAVRTGKNASGPWALSIVIVNTGEEFSTFSSTHVAIANEARQKGWPVRITEKDNSTPDRRNIETIALVDPRQGSLIDGQAAKY